MRTVAMVLAGNHRDSKVLIDNVDVTDMCVGVEVEAHVGTPTRITLILLADCRLFADVPDVTLTPQVRDEEP